MYLNCKQGLRRTVRNILTLVIIAIVIITNTIVVNPAIDDLVVFAADSSEEYSNEEYIISTSSFESDSNTDTVERAKVPTLIATSACVSSDPTNIDKEKDNIVSDTTNDKNVAETSIETDVNQEEIYIYDGSTLDSYHGVCKGPSGKETYYNLPMNGVIRIMRRMGYSEEEYPYWVRDDGVKMFGDYIMVAANLDLRPKGTILECSLGTAMVVDTGDFAKINHTQLDIATAW